MNQLITIVHGLLSIKLFNVIKFCLDYSKYNWILFIIIVSHDIFVTVLLGASQSEPLNWSLDKVLLLSQKEELFSECVRSSAKRTCLLFEKILFGAIYTKFLPWANVCRTGIDNRAV